MLSPVTDADRLYHRGRREQGECSKSTLHRCLKLRFRPRTRMAPVVPPLRSHVCSGSRPPPTSTTAIGGFAGCLLHSYLENCRYSPVLAGEILHNVTNGIL